MAKKDECQEKDQFLEAVLTENERKSGFRKTLESRSANEKQSGVLSARKHTYTTPKNNNR